MFNLCNVADLDQLILSISDFDTRLSSEKRKERKVACDPSKRQDYTGAFFSSIPFSTLPRVKWRQIGPDKLFTNINSTSNNFQSGWLYRMSIGVVNPHKTQCTAIQGGRCGWSRPRSISFHMLFHNGESGCLEEKPEQISSTTSWFI